MLPSEKRTQYFDMLRLLATLAVVALHLSAQNWVNVEVTSRAWCAFNLYDSAVRWAVPVFAMISGALFLGGTQSVKVIWKKYIARIAAAFAFWSALYALSSVIVFQYDWRRALTQFVQGYYHMWFLYMIVGLYAIIPLLRTFTKSPELMRYFLLLGLVFTFLLPRLLDYATLFSLPSASVLMTLQYYLNFHFTLGFPFYFVAGYYLATTRISRRLELLSYALGILGFAYIFLATQCLAVSSGAATEFFYGYNTPAVMLVSLAVFIFGKQRLNGLALSERARDALAVLSKYSFGAYLVHAFVIEALRYFGLGTLSFNAFFSVPVIAVLVCVVSFAISAVLNRIPVLNKYIV